MKITNIPAQVRWMVAWLGLGLATLTASSATAEDVQSIMHQNTFTSIQEVNRAAQSAGKVLARAYNWEMRIVSPALAKLLDEQGFRYDQNGILFGYEPGAIFQGYNFAEGVEFLENNSTLITIQAPRSENDSDRDTEDTEEDTPEDTEEDTPEDSPEDTPEDTEEDTHEDTV